ncbi:MAG: hypothetical protein QOG72_1510 [Sphingomonadales bacterium]|jgi:hypothetical protein|nr:hypothetical protein [Sphingomonadales bacterium]
MTRQAALQRVLVIWLIAAAIFAVFTLAQVLAGKYGDDPGVPLNWLSAQIVPVMGLLLAATLSSPSANWKKAQVTGSRYQLALTASLVQIIAILITFLIEPILQTSPFALFDSTIVFFSIWQGVVTACVGGLVFDGR